MILEIVGSRILAPYFGTSTIVWTGLIGIILACLSLGYLLGGILADRRLNYRVLGSLLFIPAVFVGIVSVVEPALLAMIQNMTAGIRMGTVVGAVSLFGLPGVLLGMVLPYAIRLKLHSLDHSGRTIGRVYAISTVGSITGTFLAGFFLIAYLGSRHILLVLSLLLLALSWFPFYRGVARAKSGVFVLLVITAAAILGAHAALKTPSQYSVDIDTAYNRVWIYESTDRATNRPVRNMATDPLVIQSEMYLDRDDDLVDGYANFYRLAEHFKPGFRKSLMIGGAGYAYPKDYLRRFKGATLDVVEIDPGMTALARQFFNLEDDPRLTIFHQDGRTFLNQTQDKYDVIMVDALRSFYSVPYQLSTIEAIAKIRDRLTEDGVLFINMIGAIEGDNGRFVRAEYATCKRLFPRVYLFPTQTRNNGQQVQNIMLVATRSDKRIVLDNRDSELTRYLNEIWVKIIPDDVPVLTDDFAPVDFYNANML
jgi:spermidine synthase